jgi:hypothetical protein
MGGTLTLIAQFPDGAPVKLTGFSDLPRIYTPIQGGQSGHPESLFFYICAIFMTN